MQIIFSERVGDALNEAGMLLAIVAKSIEPYDNSQEVRLNNSQAVSLAIFVDEIKNALEKIGA